MRFIDRRNCKSAFEKGESREIKSMGALTQEAVKIAEQNGLGVMQNRGGAFRVIRACGLGAYSCFVLGPHNTAAMSMTRRRPSTTARRSVSAQRETACCCS